MISWSKFWGKPRAVLAILTLSLFSTATSAPAYKIWPIISIHEAMTLLAQKCALEAKREAPRDCRHLLNDIADQSSILRPTLTYDDLQIAVRWADDPGRQVRSGAILSYGVNMYGNCERVLKEDSHFDVVGILCSSHFGRLQFFHAQAATPAEERNPETTREKVLEWAELTYRIAIGDVRPSERICDYFQRNPSILSSSFEFGHSEQCNPANANAWTFSTLFGWNCRSLASMNGCWRLRAGPGSDMLAVRTAKGALLHAIQDSYSQSHAVRGPPSEPLYASRIDCSLPSRFYTFLGQSGHGRADILPEIADNCRRGVDAHDVITASAMVLYHIERRTDPDIFNYCYLQRRVFGVLPRRRGEPVPDCPADT